jgi:thiamine kinase-like enzyme
MMVEHAARAAAVLHTAAISFGEPRTLDDLLTRLEAALNELSLTAPDLYLALWRLLDHLERRAARGRSAPMVPSHGDLKYDQLLEHRGRFALIDFEFFCQAEPYLDLGTFCAYLPSTIPPDWREGAAAELLRQLFVATYAEASEQPIDLERLSLYEAAMLGVRSLAQLASYQSGWRLRAGQLLELALARLLDPEPRLVGNKA